jgi:hypothetical protein
VVRAAVAFADAAWRVWRAAVVRRRRPVVALGALVAVEREDVLRAVEREDVLREVERERVDAELRVAGLRAVLVRVVAGLRAVLLRVAGLRVLLDVLRVVEVLLLPVVSAMRVSPSLRRWKSVRSCSMVTLTAEHMYVNPSEEEVTQLL